MESETSATLTSAKNKPFTAWTFLLLATLAAWFPICRPYLRMADDFHFAGWLLTGGPMVYFHEDGIWRMLGHELANGATLINPVLQGVLALCTHCVATLLLFVALRRLLVSEFLPLVLALVFAVFPWGGTALLWASGYTYVLGTALFLAAICVLLRAFPLKNSVAVALCIACSALSLFAHEALFFALLISGGFVLLREDASNGKGRLALAAAPVAGCFIWWSLYKVFPGRMPTEHIKLNPRTLLSGVYYQYTNLWIFEPWKSQSTRSLLFFDWSWWQFGIGIVLVCAVAFAIRKAITPSRHEPRPGNTDNRMLVFLLLLVVATVAIYAIGGGFSLDSRKKYPIVPVALMFAGYCIDRFSKKGHPHPHLRTIILPTLVLVGIATTWLQIGLWRYEAVRLDRLVNFLSTQPDPALVQVQWDSRIQAAWPHADQYWGALPEGWVLADAVRLKHLLAPATEPAQQARGLKFDPIQFTWVPIR